MCPRHLKVASGRDKTPEDALLQKKTGWVHLRKRREQERASSSPRSWRKEREHRRWKKGGPKESERELWRDPSSRAVRSGLEGLEERSREREEKRKGPVVVAEGKRKVQGRRGRGEGWCSRWISGSRSRGGGSITSIIFVLLRRRRGRGRVTSLLHDPKTSGLEVPGFRHILFEAGQLLGQSRHL